MIDTATRNLATAMAVPTLAVLVSILGNNSRLSDLRSQMESRFADLRSDMEARFADLSSHIDARFDDRRSTWKSELHRVEEVLDARLKHLEER